MTENKRIIKFRGRRVDNLEWLYGAGIVIIGDDYAAVPQTKNVTSRDYQIALCKVVPETVGEFTGLLDKNKKEIYEGDIDKEGNLITFERGCFWLYKKERVSILQGSPAGCYPLYRIDTERFIEVIGNFYENPELIKS